MMSLLNKIKELWQPKKEESIEKAMEINTLGEYLRYYRISYSCTIREVAKKLNINPSTIYRIEKNGKTEFWNVIRLMQFYKIDLNNIYNYIPNEEIKE